MFRRMQWKMPAATMQTVLLPNFHQSLVTKMNGSVQILLQPIFKCKPATVVLSATRLGTLRPYGEPVHHHKKTLGTLNEVNPATSSNAVEEYQMLKANRKLGSQGGPGPLVPKPQALQI